MKGISLQILKYSMLCVSVIFISSCTSGRGFKEEISTLNFGEVVEIKLNSIIGSDPALQINVPRERIEIEIKHSDGYNEILNLRQGIHKIRITNNPKYI